MERQMLEGKIAIITGASYGMGQTMAELFAEEGAAVVLTARGQEKLDAVVNGNFVDCHSPEEIRTCLDKFGRQLR